MSTQAQNPIRFVRKTELSAGESNTNFLMLDHDCIAVVTSPEADKITPLMAKIYLNLLNAPTAVTERHRVLHFRGEFRDDRWIKAWDKLCETVGVASATANKALKWLHEQGIIGYVAKKNGVGIRIFLNRATGSIAKARATKDRPGSEKILPFPRASPSNAHASPVEAAFKDNYVDLDNLDNNISSDAPETGATTNHTNKIPRAQPFSTSMSGEVSSKTQDEREIVARILDCLNPAIQIAASTAARLEHDRIRNWLEFRGIPKAARVAQHEAYNILRKHGVITESSQKMRTQADVGLNGTYAAPTSHILSAAEIDDLAQSCLALLENRGQSIEITLSEMSCDEGGPLLPADAPRVRAKAQELLIAGENRDEQSRGL